jgi:cysteinyl-tRNA synthetase, unknown class
MLLAGAAAVTVACVPEPIPQTPRNTPRHQRGIDVSAPFLAFRGRASQMGDLGRVAQAFRMIAVDAEPADMRFTRAQVEALRGDGRNTVLGIVNVGFCDRTQFYWKAAPDELLPCAANLHAQIGERSDHPQQVWMALDDYEYQELIVNYVAPRIVRAGVDGLFLDGMELLDHDDDDDEAACDADCVAGGVALLAALRKEFPDLPIVMNGGISKRVRTTIGRRRVPYLLDGVVGEDIYLPSYDAQKEADLLDWRAQRAVNGRPFAVISQDHVASCDDANAARLVYQSSLAHGFSPAVDLAATSRARVCFWGFGQ